MTPNDYQLQELRREVSELSAAVKNLVDAWNTARGVVKFVKYLSATVTTISAAIGAVWAVLHLGGTR